MNDPLTVLNNIEVPVYESLQKPYEPWSKRRKKWLATMRAQLKGLSIYEGSTVQKEYDKYCKNSTDNIDNMELFESAEALQRRLSRRVSKTEGLMVKLDKDIQNMHTTINRDIAKTRSINSDITSALDKLKHQSHQSDVAIRLSQRTNIRDRRSGIRLGDSPVRHRPKRGLLTLSPSRPSRPVLQHSDGVKNLERPQSTVFITPPRKSVDFLQSPSIANETTYSQSNETAKFSPSIIINSTLSKGKLALRSAQGILSLLSSVEADSQNLQDVDNTHKNIDSLKKKSNRLNSIRFSYSSDKSRNGTEKIKVNSDRRDVMNINNSTIGVLKLNYGLNEQNKMESSMKDVDIIEDETIDENGNVNIDTLIEDKTKELNQRNITDSSMKTDANDSLRLDNTLIRLSSASSKRKVSETRRPPNEKSLLDRQGNYNPFRSLKKRLDERENLENKEKNERNRILFQSGLKNTFRAQSVIRKLMKTDEEKKNEIQLAIQKGSLLGPFTDEERHTAQKLSSYWAQLIFADNAAASNKSDTINNEQPRPAINPSIKAIWDKAIEAIKCGQLNRLESNGNPSIILGKQAFDSDLLAAEPLSSACMSRAGILLLESSMAPYLRRLMLMNEAWINSEKVLSVDKAKNIFSLHKSKNQNNSSDMDGNGGSKKGLLGMILKKAMKVVSYDSQIESKNSLSNIDSKNDEIKKEQSEKKQIQVLPSESLSTNTTSRISSIVSEAMNPLSSNYLSWKDVLKSELLWISAIQSKKASELRDLVDKALDEVVDQMLTEDRNDAQNNKRDETPISLLLKQKLGMLKPPPQYAGHWEEIGFDTDSSDRSSCQGYISRIDMILGKIMNLPPDKLPCNHPAAFRILSSTEQACLVDEKVRQKVEFLTSALATHDKEGTSTPSIRNLPYQFVLHQQSHSPSIFGKNQNLNSTFGPVYAESNLNQQANKLHPNYLNHISNIQNNNSNTLGSNVLNLSASASTLVSVTPSSNNNIHATNQFASNFSNSNVSANNGINNNTKSSFFFSSTGLTSLAAKRLNSKLSPQSQTVLNRAFERKKLHECLTPPHSRNSPHQVDTGGESKIDENQNNAVAEEIKPSQIWSPSTNRLISALDLQSAIPIQLRSIKSWTPPIMYRPQSSIPLLRRAINLENEFITQNAIRSTSSPRKKRKSNFFLKKITSRSSTARDGNLEDDSESSLSSEDGSGGENVNLNLSISDSFKKLKKKKRKRRINRSRILQHDELISSVVTSRIPSPIASVSSKDHIQTDGINTRNCIGNFLSPLDIGQINDDNDAISSSSYNATQLPPRSIQSMAAIPKGGLAKSFQSDLSGVAFTASHVPSNFNFQSKQTSPPQNNSTNHAHNMFRQRPMSCLLSAISHLQSEKPEILSYNPSKFNFKANFADKTHEFSQELLFMEKKKLLDLTNKSTKAVTEDGEVNNQLNTHSFHKTSSVGNATLNETANYLSQNVFSSMQQPHLKLDHKVTPIVDNTSVINSCNLPATENSSTIHHAESNNRKLLSSSRRPSTTDTINSKSSKNLMQNDILFASSSGALELEDQSYGYITQRPSTAKTSTAALRTVMRTPASRLKINQLGLLVSSAGGSIKRIIDAEERENHELQKRLIRFADDETREANGRKASNKSALSTGLNGRLQVHVKEDADGQVKLVYPSGELPRTTLEDESGVISADSRLIELTTHDLGVPGAIEAARLGNDEMIHSDLKALNYVISDVEKRFPNYDISFRRDMTEGQFRNLKHHEKIRTVKFWETSQDSEVLNQQRLVDAALKARTSSWESANRARKSNLNDEKKNSTRRISFERRILNGRAYGLWTPQTLD